jgi:hypothetical protein
MEKGRAKQGVVKKGKMKQGIMKQWNNRKKINGTHEH